MTQNQTEKRLPCPIKHGSFFCFITYLRDSMMYIAAIPSYLSPISIPTTVPISLSSVRSLKSICSVFVSVRP